MSNSGTHRPGHLDNLKHMSSKTARLVDSRKTVAGCTIGSPTIRHRNWFNSLDWVAGSLARDPKVLSDKKRLAAICNSDPHELCAARGSSENTCRKR